MGEKDDEVMVKAATIGGAPGPEKGPLNQSNLWSDQNQGQLQDDPPTCSRNEKDKTYVWS